MNDKEIIEMDKYLSSHIFSGFMRGYWRALLDFKNAVDKIDTYWLKSKKQYATYISSFLDCLLKDSLLMEQFKDYGGEPDFKELGYFISGGKDKLKGTVYKYK